MSDWNKAIIEEFRANGGKVGGRFMNRNLLLLHTTGAKSGIQHVTPVVYMENGDRLVIIASKGGAPTHPGWYYNLIANPEVSVEVGTEQYQAKATVAVEPTRSELYKKMAKLYPFFSEYEQKTTRVIPVIILERLP